MFKILYSFLFCLFFCDFKMWSQEKIWGEVTNEKEQPCEYASVSILRVNDSTFISGCVTNSEGKFRIVRQSTGECLLKVTYLGYKDYYRVLPTSADNVGVIKMNPDELTLKEVTIKGSKPIYQSKNGSLITNVSGTILGRLHEMTDLITQIPGIVKTANGSFEVFGLGAPIIYINSKKVQDTNELKSLSPKEIKSIELITNPGAKYDAEGKSVLRVFTLKKDEGFTLQAGINAKQNDDTSYGGDFKVGYKRNRFNISATYGYGDNKNRSNLPQSKTLFINEDIHNFVQEQKSKGKLTSHEWNFNVDYEINEKHNIGIEWDASSDKDSEHRSSMLDYNLNGRQIQLSNIANDYQNNIKFNHLNIFHNAQWSQKISTELNLDYASNTNKYKQNTYETSEKQIIQTLSSSKNSLDIYAGKLAFNYKFSNSLNLDWGIEYNHINGSGRQTTNSEFTPSSNYTNKEDNIAGYVELTTQIGKIGINGGLRYENLISDYTDLMDATGNVHRHYRNIFPSLSLTHNTNGWSNTLSFSSRTNRPTFRQLSNSSYYSNEFMYQKGNPLLKQSNSYIAQWTCGYKFLNFSASYTYMKDYISTDFYTSQNEITQIVSSYSNYDKIQYLKANLNLQKNISWWSPSFTLGCVKPFFNYEYRGQNMSYNKAQIYILVNQYFTLPASCLLSMYYYFNSGGNQGAVELKPFQMLNIGIQKSFCNEKLSISFNARDLFHTMKYKETERINNILFQQTENYYLWNYSVSIIYRLNKTKTRYRGKTSIEKELDRL